MNEQLQQALSELINKGMGGIDKASNFLSAEIPDVIFQLLLWHGVYEFICFLICIISLVIIIYANYQQFKWLKTKDKYWFNEHGELLLANLFQIFLLIVPMSLINIQWLQIWIAPKVWLLEYASNLIK